MELVRLCVSVYTVLNNFFFVFDICSFHLFSGTFC
jgi:hypothetical protein